MRDPGLRIKFKSHLGIFLLALVGLRLRIHYIFNFVWLLQGKRTLADVVLFPSYSPIILLDLEWKDPFFRCIILSGI